MSDHDLLLMIRDLLDGTAWEFSTFVQIATLLSENGYTVHDLKGKPYP
jgi:hypothetical protein